MVDAEKTYFVNKYLHYSRSMQIVILLVIKLPCENSGTKGPELCIVAAYLAPVRSLAICHQQNSLK
jgi:hypothetical protein